MKVLEKSIAITLLIIFIMIAGLVITNNIHTFDDSIYQLIISIRNPFWDSFFTMITKCGNTLTVIFICLILLLLFPKKEKLFLASNVGITVLLNQAMKYVIKRSRPNHLRLIKQGGYSFSSGHAMISIALYGLLIYWIDKRIENNVLKQTLKILLILLIIGIGISRIYVGVHYPSDIIAGYSLALIILITIKNIYQTKVEGKENGENDCK